MSKYYGLGPMEFGDPELYGRKMDTVRIIVDSSTFVARFESGYHVSVWLFPPLGGSPDHPPAPVCGLSFSNVNDEIYVIGMEEERFRYLVFHRDPSSTISTETAYWRLYDGQYRPLKDGGNEVWELSFRIARNLQ